jgi:hypothetical protein
VQGNGKTSGVSPGLLSAYALAARSLQEADNGMNIDTFRNTLRLEADDLQRQQHQVSQRVPLRLHHNMANSIQVKYLDDHRLKLSWSVDDGRATESQVLTVHWGVVPSLRCPECKKLRRRLFFTTHDHFPFNTKWFHCGRCIDQHLERGKHDRRPETSFRKAQHRRAERAHDGAVTSEPLATEG